MRRASIIFPLIALLALSCAAVLSGCGKKPDPRIALEKYLVAQRNRDIEGLWRNLSEASRKALKKSEFQRDLAAALSLESLSWELGRREVKGNGATIEATLILGVKRLPLTYVLAWEDGAWKVDYFKSFGR